jgi:hypothetical protein
MKHIIAKKKTLELDQLMDSLILNIHLCVFMGRQT